MNISNKLEELLRNSQSICVLTGAGISAESGVPTFRGTDGLWTKLSPDELASFDGFMREPKKVWSWFQQQKEIMHSARPNESHYALATMETLVKDFTLVTQNIDNLHRRAGSKHVLELHGNIERSYCMKCGKYVSEVKITEEHPVPYCQCGGIIRPDVVWFGETLPEEEYSKAVTAASRCELFISVGTSAVVYPAAALPLIAKQNGAYVVEVNIEYTELSSHADETLIGKASEVLPQLVELMKKERQ
jgi:NAD-dependent deacetylase